MDRKLQITSHSDERWAPLWESNWYKVRLYGGLHVRAQPDQMDTQFQTQAIALLLVSKYFTYIIYSYTSIYHSALLYRNSELYNSI